MTPPPPPLKLLNRICIDLKNDPNGSEKNGFPLKNGKIPCLSSAHELFILLDVRLTMSTVVMGWTIINF